MLGLSWSLALLLCGLFSLTCSLFNVPDVRLSGRAPHLVPLLRLIISTILHRPFKNIKLNVRINRILILRTWKDEDDSILRVFVPHSPWCSRVFSILFQPSERG
ncbi:hypothetical protein BJV77DRAFT_991157 [Russula vinacea]|nr:hypothetical protein BJV77DRAFT_991157 [Russula vinacea]